MNNIYMVNYNYNLNKSKPKHIQKLGDLSRTLQHKDAEEDMIEPYSCNFSATGAGPITMYL